jgi:hypothetical protein
MSANKGFWWLIGPIFATPCGAAGTCANEQICPEGWLSSLN